MKKIKRLFMISIIVGIISIGLSIYSLLNMEKLFQVNDYYKISTITSLITSIIVTIMYIYFFICKVETALKKKCLLVIISICSLFSPIILLIMNFITLNNIAGYTFDKKMKQASMIYIKPQVNLSNNSFNQSDLNATFIAKEYKRIKNLREQNLITEEEYQKLRQVLLSKIGLDSSEVEEIDHNTLNQQ